MRSALLLAISCALAGCALDALHHYDRPAFAEIGLNSRHFASSPVSASDTGLAARTTSPEASTTGGNAATMSFRFRMHAKWNTYAGAEAEAGYFMGRSGSSYSGLYGVFGALAPFSSGALAAELTTGWRKVRDSVESADQSSLALEPRVRGELWFGEQYSLGAMAGASLAEHAWTAGIYIGISSHTRAGMRVSGQ